MSAIVFVMIEYADNGSDPEKWPITLNALKELVEICQSFPKVFKAKCEVILSCWEKAAKDHYFNMLRYSLIFAKRGQELISALKDARCHEKKTRMQRCGKEIQGS